MGVVGSQLGELCTARIAQLMKKIDSGGPQWYYGIVGTIMSMRSEDEV